MPGPSGRSGGEARLLRPEPEAEPPYEGHVLVVLGGPAVGARPAGGGESRVGRLEMSARANPDVEAWHEAEKQRVEAECDEMLRRLACEKRRRLEHITDRREQELAAELRRLARAERRVEAEVVVMEHEQEEAEEAAAKVPPKKALVDDAEAIRCRWEQKVTELEDLIARKKVCVEELRSSTRKLLETQRELARAKKRLAAREAEAEAVKANVTKYKGHVTREEEDVDNAMDELAAARARLDAAEKKLCSAEADLADHDSAPADAYLGGDSDMEGAAVTPAPALGGASATTRAPAAERRSAIIPNWSGREKAAAERSQLLHAVVVAAVVIAASRALVW